MALSQHCSLHIFHLGTCLRKRLISLFPLELGFCLGLRLRKPKKLRAPGMLQVQNACQGEHGPTPTLFLTLLSAQHLLQQKTDFGDLLSVRVPLRAWVEKSTKPRAQGTLALQNACQGEHGTAQHGFLHTFLLRTTDVLGTSANSFFYCSAQRQALITTSPRPPGMQKLQKLCRRGALHVI